MKKNHWFLLLFVLCMLLCSCMAERDSEAVLGGENFSTGEFQVFVPDGWTVFPITDPFAEDKPVKTNCIFLNKGGNSDGQVFAKPYIKIDHYAPEQPMETPVPMPNETNIEYYQEMEIGEFVWNGFAADTYYGRARTGRFATLWTEDGEHRFLAFLCFQSGGEEISLEDNDVQAILSGISVEEEQQ